VLKSPLEEGCFPELGARGLVWTWLRNTYAERADGKYGPLMYRLPSREQDLLQGGPSECHSNLSVVTAEKCSGVKHCLTDTPTRQRHHPLPTNPRCREPSDGAWCPPASLAQGCRAGGPTTLPGASPMPGNDGRKIRSGKAFTSVLQSWLQSRRKSKDTVCRQVWCPQNTLTDRDGERQSCI